ncbi:8-amino-7-oxononanoate synthase [Flavobacterium pallidum]|uniref:8-amino-7-oxononanoate synthase n=1 Tax=Flavobacterium pallidum TaxID=2172098 RepID=A0A2S1SL50_9FLAO|nr:8-amino-7-oxononanoate synthase [Flavobacterium pallidum]AWI27135.1 8-amino-7-oxononanoate synthase [Flavobacterium pallidum]
MAFTFEIFSDVNQLPPDWDGLAKENIFLSRDYLEVLQLSAPDNMECHFIVLLESGKTIGIALSQFLDVNQLESFGDRDKCLRASARKLVFRNFSSRVLFIGNNMLTGQNAFVFAKDTDRVKTILALKAAAISIRDSFTKKGKKIHLTTFKDFDDNEAEDFRKAGFKDHLEFSTQPNMVFTMRADWHSEQDYIGSLSKKYRDQYKRARKKSDGVHKRKMPLEDIIKYEDAIYDLYFHVAKNAPFNTFFLSKNHFRIFKEKLRDKFLFYGYFLEEKLIGFNTLIKNGKSMDTYFLGYDDNIQRDKMLYLNMLYDMIAYSINKGFCEIVFGRTALEIKSSVGAQPVPMYGFMQHGNGLVNKNMDWIFKRLEPVAEWQQRNPFK